MARIRGDIHRPGLHHGCPGYMRRRHRHGSMDPFQLLERTRPAGKGGGIDRRTGQAESIASAFAAIGSQGREALAHMRQLLRVLRETGFSDEAHAGKSEEMRLKPAASLDEQMKSGFFRGMFQR